MGDVMKDIGKLISQLRADRKLSQDALARRVKCTKQTISNYERDIRRPDYEMLEALADALNVPVTFFVTPAEQRDELDRIYSGYSVSTADRPAAVPIRVPILGTIPAGIPLEAIEDVIDYEEIPADMARGGKEYFGLKVKGDSMSPRYEDGDVLIFRVQDSCESGQDCAVIVNGNEATFKRVRLSPQGITLHPLNPAYETRFFTNQEINDLPVRILGVVVELRRKI